MARKMLPLLLIAMAAVASLDAAPAQVLPAKLKHLVILDGGTKNPAVNDRIAAVRKQLALKGWIDGKTLRTTVFFGNSDAEEVRDRVRRIAKTQPDAVLVFTGNAALQIKRAIANIPIVFANVSNPIGSGLIPSLARPGDNITGVATWDISAAGKLVDTLYEVAPTIRHVATIMVPVHSDKDAYGSVVKEATDRLGWTHTHYSAKDASELRLALRDIRRSPRTAIILLPDPVTLGNEEMVIQYALIHKIPSISFTSQFVAKGGLIAYGIDQARQYRDAGDLLDLVLRGVPASNLPVRLPDRYEFSLNLKTFESLGLTVPPSILVQASKIIEK